MALIDKETIRAEIRRRLSLIYLLEGDFTDGSRDAYEGLLSWLDTLPEQPEVDLENYIFSKLRELGADLTDPFNRGLNVGMTNAYNDILNRLNVRKEESVEVAESPSKTFPRVNEFDCGSSYRR